MNPAPTKSHSTPDLGHFRQHYPLTVQSFGALPAREAWLRRIWELDARWLEAMEGKASASTEVVFHEPPPSGLQIEAEFDVIYAGGVLGLLHAAVMAGCYNRRVLVFDRHTVGRTHRDWNISDEELREFNCAGLFTREELEAAIVNRYRSGFVKFHDQGSSVKAPPLWVNGVLDVALSADKLLELAAEKLRRNGPKGSQLIDNLRFVRCYVEPHRITVHTEDTRSGAARLFSARLFVDSTGTNSSVSRQLNNGQALTHVCPTVGTVARGFARGPEPDQVDFGVGEILVSTEDASDHRQLIWEGFARSLHADEYTTYLFFYDAVKSPADKSLLSLFERYFETLPQYKRAGAQWRVVKPVFGFIPSFHHYGWKNRKQTATDRVMLIGDAAGLSSPLTLCGFGSHVSNLHRLTHLAELALKADLLDGRALSEINAYEPRVAQMASLAEFMRPTAQSQPASVNETMNAVMQALHGLDERVRKELFQDRMSFSAFKNLLTRTAKLYPGIFKRMKEHLGARGTFWWIAGITEALLNERRRRANTIHTLPSSEIHSDAAADEFARYINAYQQQREASEGSDESHRQHLKSQI